MGYDRLLVAAGSSPVCLPIEGLETVENKFTFLNLDSAKKLRAAIGKNSRVLIIGAGLIGLKCAEGISKTVASITVADIPRQTFQHLEPEGAQISKSLL
jgi:NADPH-dependent 2,4-dienoyl-CoA reductase/sulfur reductase-like enzyme